MDGIQSTARSNAIAQYRAISQLGAEEKSDGTKASDATQQTDVPKEPLPGILSTFDDMTHLLKRLSPDEVDTSNWGTVDKNDLSFYRLKMTPKQVYMAAKYASNNTSILTPDAVGAAEGIKKVLAEVENVIGRFYDGDLSVETLQQEYERLAKCYANVLKEHDYPNKLVARSYQAEYASDEVFYDEFRRITLDVAVKRNNGEGKQYITGEINVFRNVRYYNSDYYYKSETVISAITERAFEMVDKHENKLDGYEFKVPDYKGKNMNRYYNFNSAWDSNAGLSAQYIVDYDKAPPKNFQWFYQTGGESPTDGTIRAVLIEEKPFNGFDLKDPLTARMWAKYHDENGNEHFAFNDFRYNGSDDLRTVSSLMKFSAKAGSGYSEVNSFLDNFRVHSYWENNPLKCGGFRASI